MLCHVCQKPVKKWVVKVGDKIYHISCWKNVKEMVPHKDEPKLVRVEDV